MAEDKTPEIIEGTGKGRSVLTRLFWDKKFMHYTWIGVFISFLNIFFIWLLIDIFNVPTVIASTVVIGLTFILRYILLIFSKVL